MGTVPNFSSADTPKNRDRHLFISVDWVHIYVYILFVKRKDLEKTLRDMGWRLLRHGGRHDVWTDGEFQETVPRHREIHERLALFILRRAGRKNKP